METVIRHFLSRRAFVGSVAALGLGAAGMATTSRAAAAEAGPQDAGEPGSGSTYLFAHITLRPGTVGRFTQALGEVAPLFEKYGGWKLQACYLQAGSGGTTIVDVWEIPNVEAIQKNLDAAPSDPAFRELVPRFRECVTHETFRVMEKQPVSL